MIPPLCHRQGGGRDPGCGHLVEAELLTRGTPEAPEAVTLDVPKADPHALSLDPLRGIVTLLKPQRCACHASCGHTRWG